MRDFMKDCRVAAGLAVDLRHTIHRHPELGNAETETSALIVRVLKHLDWQVEQPVGTAVSATLNGRYPGRMAAFRADMDALRIQEATELAYASENPGVMHACGHDFHCAGLLGAAMVLTPHRDELRGGVRLLFQPDEEGLGGAQRMIDAGCLAGVDAVFGAHVDPDLPAGTVGFKYGKMYAASDVFKVIVRGEGCHGASPEAGVDAIAIGAQVVTALQQIVSRRVAPTDSAVLTVGSFHAGAQPNVVADSAELEGILRTLGPETRSRVKRMLTETVEGVCAAMGARAELQIRESYPGVVNDDSMVDLARAAAVRTLGEDAVRLIDSPPWPPRISAISPRPCPARSTKSASATRISARYGPSTARGLSPTRPPCPP